MSRRASSGSPLASSRSVLSLASPLQTFPCFGFELCIPLNLSLTMSTLLTLTGTLCQVKVASEMVTAKR
uniref:Uncharacterized protein n=1 Tax=Ixodes ricinus TaxID=34613 RepID=A0A6B0U1W9_IXORI